MARNNPSGKLAMNREAVMSRCWGVGYAVLVIGASAVALTAHGAKADELDFPQDPDAQYSVTDLHQFACLREEMTRLVYLEYSDVVGEPPCSVVYEKGPPGQPTREVLWRAENTQGYCEAQARAFVEKLRKSNWKCGLFRDVFSVSE